jgi:hypothetical protein
MEVWFKWGRVPVSSLSSNTSTAKKKKEGVHELRWYKAGGRTVLWNTLHWISYFRKNIKTRSQSVSKIPQEKLIFFLIGLSNDKKRQYRLKEEEGSQLLFEKVKNEKGAYTFVKGHRVDGVL